jgi:hypothetical protein
MDSSTALALHSLTDMYLEKQSEAFRSALAVHAAGDRCFTAVGTTRHGVAVEFNLEADSAAQVAAFLFGINAILTHKGGRKVMTAADSEREEKARKEKAREAQRLNAEKDQSEQQRVAAASVSDALLASAD